MLKENAATQKQIDDIDSQIAVLKKQLEAQISTLQRGNASITEESSAYEIQVAQLDDQLRKCHITSPICGTVLAKYAEAGELATQGKPLFKVADVQHLFLRAYITADQLSQLKLGDKVKVFSDLGKDDRRNTKGQSPGFQTNRNSPLKQSRHVTNAPIWYAHKDSSKE